MVACRLSTGRDRGWDGAGMAIYGADTAGRTKLTVQSDTADRGCEGLDGALAEALSGDVSIRVIDTHAVLETPARN